MFYYPLTVTTENAEAIDSFYLQSLADPYDQFPVKSRLLYEGRDTGVAIQGIGLDFQFRGPGYYLLFANWSCPFEESVEITLLSDSFECLAHHSISHDYGSMHLESVESLGSAQFRLSCADGQNYQLNLPLNRLSIAARAGYLGGFIKRISASSLRVKKI